MICNLLQTKYKVDLRSVKCQSMSGLSKGIMPFALHMTENSNLYTDAYCYRYWKIVCAWALPVLISLLISVISICSDQARGTSICVQIDETVCLGEERCPQK